MYKATYDLLFAIFQFTKNFSKEYKYTVGESLKKETIELITHIYRANTRKDKVETLQVAREHIVEDKENIEETEARVLLVSVLRQGAIEKTEENSELELSHNSHIQARLSTRPKWSFSSRHSRHAPARQGACPVVSSLLHLAG